MKKTIWKILNFIGIGAYIQSSLNGYLLDMGWPNSFHKKAAIDKNNAPIPWLTYPFLYFIEPRLNKDLTMFEYGAGNSTIWFSKRLKSIKSVEHNKDWFNNLLSILPDKSNLIFQEDSIDGLYAKEILVENKKYDIVLVDANDRYNCAKYALEALSENGVIILDNTERAEYKEIYDLITAKGFRYIDFEGISAGIHARSITSVFYRTNNCLNI